MRGAILAGGGATRFGAGRRGWRRSAASGSSTGWCECMTAALGRPPLLVANAPRRRTWRPGPPRRARRRPGLGSLGGIYTAVVEAPAPVVCVAWDMPFVSEALVRELAAGLERHDACLPESDGRRGVEPLCAGLRSGLPRRHRRRPGPGGPPGRRLPRPHRRRYPPSAEVRALRRPGAPVLQREHRGRPRASGRAVASTRIISIIGRKNAGKTTLTVALARELDAARPPGHDHQARPPSGRGGPRRHRHLAALPRGPRRADVIAGRPTCGCCSSARPTTTIRSAWPGAT